MARQQTETTGDGFAQLGDALSQALRDELEELRGDLASRASAAARGTGLLAASGASGAIAVGAVAALPLMALRRLLPAWLLALAIGGGAAAAAACLARRGLDELATA